MNHLIDTVETTGLHPWGPGRREVDAAGLESWIRGRLDLAAPANRSAPFGHGLAQRTFENTLRPYDDAVATLSAAGSLASLLDSVYPNKGSPG